MDPITMAITGALANLGTTVIKDAYDALKVALQAKFDVGSDLDDAIKGLEKKRDSKGREGTLAEEVEAVQADKDPEILKLVNALQAKINEESGQSGGTTTNITQTARDNATQIGKVDGDVTFNK